MTSSTNEILRDIDVQLAVKNILFRQLKDPDDIPAMADVIRNAMQADHIERSVREKDISLALQNLTNFDIETDTLVAEVEGNLVGFVRLHWQEMSDGQRSYRYVAPLAPEWRRKKIGSLFLHFAEARAKAMSKHHPKNQEKILEVASDEREVGKIALFRANGYQPTRYFIDMVRNLEHKFPDAPMPEGLRVRPAKPEHYRKVWMADNEAFREIMNQLKTNIYGGVTIGTFNPTYGK